MVWFNDAGRFRLCEAGISGYLDIPMRPCIAGFSGYLDEPIKVCFSGFSGYMPKER